MNTEPTQASSVDEQVPLIENLDTETLVMAALSYAGPLLLVPLLVKRDQSFVQYHLRQGIVLFGLYLAIQIVMSMFMFTMLMWPVMNIVNLGILVLMILGVVNVVKKQEKALPLIGSLASYIKL